MKLILCLLALTSAASPGWELSQPLPDLTEPYECPATVVEGPFELIGTFSLKKVDGTAASVKFGDALNFGFDGRNQHLFVEGQSIGKVRSLGWTREHLQADKPFRFKAVRRTDGVLAVSIDDTEVFKTDKLAAWSGSVILRPHRNHMMVRSLKLTGSVKKPKPGLRQSRSPVPLLIDGELHPVLDLDLVLTEPRVLRKVDIKLSPPDLHSAIRIFRNGKELMGATELDQRMSLAGKTPLPAGRHRLEVRAAAKRGIPPTGSFRLSCATMHFDDGAQLKPAGPDVAGMRLAYPIHKQGQFGCHTFRIPAIARANDGSLLAVYDMRYNSRRDLQGHMDIGLSRSTDGGITWADPVPIMDMGEWGGKPEDQNGCSDPGIVVDRTTGEVLVTAVWTHGKPGTHQWTGNGSEPGHSVDRSTQFMIVRSKDHGQTWSKPENLTKDLKDPAWYLFAPAPGNGITLGDGTLVMPTQGRDEKGLPFSNLIWSKDHGKTWTVSSPARSNTTECAVTELSDGSLLLNMRDNRNRSDKSDTNGRAMAQTKDLGATWSVHPADHGALPEPVCMASMISHKLPDGRHLLFFSNPRNRHSRQGMTIQISFDDGVTWPEEHHLLLDAKGGAYSSLVMIDDHTLGILYESSQADLVFQRFPLEELMN